MYESFYGFKAKPFQLRPDPQFFFGSKGHKRAMAYLEYGIGQGEGFIVITGEVGAGKTTLVRNLFHKLQDQNIVASQIVNTHMEADDILRAVVAAYGLPFATASKAELLSTFERFLKNCDQQGKRVLLVVDEAQNLTPRAVEELRMLSNFQTDDRSLLQTFLLGQPEFRQTLLGPGMQQLLQRVIATYHLGPLDAFETQAYIEHRLRAVGWQDKPTLDDGAFAAIYDYTGGIPRKINLLCDRLFLMGYLEELHAFKTAEVVRVIKDITHELAAPGASVEAEEKTDALNGQIHPLSMSSLEQISERLNTMERSVLAALSLMKKLLGSISTTTASRKETDANT